MPRLVDHAVKRRRLIEATWRLIARSGVEAATMRQIAEEAGYANGALRHYFRDKDDLLEAAYLYVYDQTNQRIAEVLPGISGTAALRRYCYEIMPLTETTLLEARIVIAFWDRATSQERLAEITARHLERWRVELAQMLAEGRDEGSVSSPVGDEVLAEALLSMMLGLQALAVLAPSSVGPTRQLDMLEAFLLTLQCEEGAPGGRPQVLARGDEL